MNCPENAPVSTSLIIVLAIINHAFECSTKPKCPASGNVIRAAVSCYAMNFTSLRHDVTYHNTNILNPECHVARPIYAAANARRTVEEIYARAMLFLWQPPSSRTKGGCHTSFRRTSADSSGDTVPGKLIWPEGGRQEATVNAAPAAAKAMTLNEPPFLNTRCAASHAAGRETELVSLRRGKQSVSRNAVSLCVVFGSRITAG